MSQNETPRIIKDQNSRARPRDRSAFGMNEATPDISSPTSRRSVRAVSWKERGRKRAARMNAANAAATAANHNLFRVFRDAPQGHSRRESGVAMITVVI